MEWLEADGLGGFASGSADGIRTRRYHALLLTATTPPTGRMVLVNGFDAWITTPGGRFALSTQRYQPGVLHPDGHTRIVSFTTDPWPTWTFETPDGVRVTQEILVEHGTGTVLVAWHTHTGASRGQGLSPADLPPSTELEVRPFLSGRDYHALHHENSAFRFTPDVRDGLATWHPYDGVPAVHVHTNGAYTHGQAWYRNFVYTIERERGLDDTEDLASPGIFSWTLGGGDDAVLVMSTAPPPSRSAGRAAAARRAARIRAAEATRRRGFATVLDRAADAYLVRRGSGRSIVAGYPWFTDWGRDTFISMRGLCIATGRLAEARDILREWAGAVSEGMLPNRFSDRADDPAEFNAVDASLWFVIAVHDLVTAAAGGDVLRAADGDRLYAAVTQILEGYSRGTRYGIRADADGLLAAGEAGAQLTWMDARVGDREITPRIGKPVEVQALWLNALWIASARDGRWREPFERGRAAFDDRFWNANRSCLYDVVDAGHVPGACDPAVRPNQIFAIGGLPLALVDGERAVRVVDRVEHELLTPVGLRTLAPSDPGYGGCYDGPPWRRDACYHQGTVWPWLMGAFVDAWVRVRGGTDAARREARERFVAPLVARAARAGGHLFEIADGDPPHTPRGCPFQAWSVGELIRAERATR
jgi:predicted glycogen debranching enzyme